MQGWTALDAAGPATLAGFLLMRHQPVVPTGAQQDAIGWGVVKANFDMLILPDPPLKANLWWKRFVEIVISGF